MKELRDPLSRLSDKHLQKAERSDLSTMHFSDAVAKLRVLRRLGHAFAQERADELPAAVVQGVRTMMPELASLVAEMVTFEVENPNASSERNQIHSKIDSHYQQMVNNYRQHIRGQVDAAAAVERVEHAEARAAELLSVVEGTAARSDELVARAETLAAEMAAGNLSSYYDEQALTHDRTSKIFLTAGAVGTAALTALAVILFVTIDDRPTDQWTAYVRDLGVRVFVLGLGLYVVGFLVKGYRANQHLLVVNQHKANALKTFRLFQEAVSEDGSTRDLITAELVKAVFAADETGFLDNAPDRTVVEGQSGLLALLAKQGRG